MINFIPANVGQPENLKISYKDRSSGQLVKKFRLFFTSKTSQFLLRFEKTRFLILSLSLASIFFE